MRIFSNLNLQPLSMLLTARIDTKTKGLISSVRFNSKDGRARDDDTWSLKDEGRWLGVVLLVKEAAASKLLLKLSLGVVQVAV